MKLALCLVMALAVGAHAAWPMPHDGDWPKPIETIYSSPLQGSYGGQWWPTYGSYGASKCSQVDPNSPQPTYLSLVTAEYLDVAGVWNCTGDEDVVPLAACKWVTKPNVTNWNISFALFCNVNATDGMATVESLSKMPSLTVDAMVEDPDMTVTLLPSNQSLVANKSECDNESIPTTKEITADRVNLIWAQELKTLGWESPYVKCQNVTKSVVDQCVLWRYPAYEWRIQFNASCASNSSLAPLSVQGAVFTYPPNVTIIQPTGLGKLDLSKSQGAY